MPTTINGIGTRYVGRKDLSQHQGQCESCGREATLSSYDTRLFFCVVFIPVVPLEKKRVIDDCSRCRRHRAMPLDAYRRLRSETLSDLEAATRGHPADAEAALSYNAALLEFGRAEEGRRHLESLVDSFPGNAEVLFYAAAFHERAGDAGEAGRLFDRAYDADPSFAPARRAKALQLVEQGQLGEARSLLSGGGAEEARDPAVLFLLGKAYQARSDHMTALEVFRQMMHEFPATAQEKEVRRAVKASEKAIGSPTSALPGRRFAWGKLGAAAAILAALAATVGAFNLYLQSNAPLHVVNAYPGPLTVELDAEHRVALPGPGRTVIEVPEGVYRARVGGGLEEMVEIDLRRTLTQRFSTSRVHVLNPGGLAVLISEETVYSAGDMPDYEAPLRLHAGTRFFAVGDIDYEFREFPESIQLSSSSSKATKRRIDVLEGEPAEMLDWLLTYGDVGESLGYLEGWLGVTGDGALAESYSSTALLAGQAARAADFLRPRLTLDPVNVEWHRAYQAAASALDGGAAALLAEYSAHLAARPDSSMLLYLRGRIDPEPRSAQRFHQRALATDPGNRFARRGSAYVANALGEFDAASGVAGGAASESRDERLDHLYFEALLGAGRHEPLERELRAGLAGENAPDWGRARRLVLTLASEGHSAEAREEIDALARRESAELGEAGLLGPWLRAQLYYADADWDGLRNHIRRPSFPQFWQDPMSFWLAVETGDVETATRVQGSAEAPTDEALNSLVLSLLYGRQGMAGMSDRWLAQALDRMPHHRETARAFRRLLDGELPLTRANLDLLVTDPGLKAALLTVLAVRHEEHRDWLLREADRFNFSPAFPYHFLRSFRA